MADSNDSPDSGQDNRLGVGKNFLVVGIGASAGGIAALKDFFESVPSDSGMAYVVILHLSPDYESKLADVLQVVSNIPVKKIEDQVKIEPDHVYVIPSHKSLTVADGILLTRNIQTVEERRAPVDIFFRALAESHAERAVAVILSGTGANGSMGIKRIKENGGVAFVQNPRQAEFNQMPRNAIATDLIDAILPVREIPAKIISYKASLGSVRIASEATVRTGDQETALRDIFTRVRVRTGHDFTNYKRATVLRRIERRINVHSLPDLQAYAIYIRDVPEEAQALLKDLLISVTNFFRDKESFQYLEEEIIPKLIKGKSAEDRIRVWVAGCATGEEAYTIAMLFAEQVSDRLEAPMIQIFATDIDEDALTHAREGFYSLNDAVDVSFDRLRHFFVKEGDRYRVQRDIRQMILFAKHNVIKDPPFSRLDMITCRNLLIYLNQPAQARVMETFHFALNPGGFLFIGSSESVDGAGDFYLPVSKEHHIYQSSQVSSRPIPVPEAIPSFRFDPPQLMDVTKNLDKRVLERITYSELHQQLLERYAPPSVVVNQDFEVVHVSERAGRYFQVGGGEPSNNLLKLIRQELRLELRSALYQAMQTHVNLEVKNLKVTVDEGTEQVNIYIRPVLDHTDIARGYILIIFEKVLEDKGNVEQTPVMPDLIAHQLEEELVRSKAQLRGSIEQYEVQAEELKASNEELQAMNEELRSSAEELETSKEELQSINEELTTVNQELKIKIEELSHSNNNFQNLINSTDIGTIFLDRSFRVNLFTPSARHIFNLISNDTGRPLSDISHRLINADVLHDAETVLEKLQMVEREVRTTDSRVYMMRILPYRTGDDRINGVVITFIDITARKNTETDLRVSEENLRLIMDSTADYAIITLDANANISGWNKAAQKIFGYSDQEAIGQDVALLFTPEDIEAGVVQEEINKAKQFGRAEDERWHIRKDGSRFYFSGVMTLLKEGKLGYVKIARDMTESKLVEQQKDEFIAIASHELKTPVTSIKSYTELLSDMVPESENKEAYDLIRKLNSQIDRLNKLIGDLLDTTQLAGGHILFKKEKFDINSLIEECRDSFQKGLKNHRIVTITKKVPEIVADKVRMRQVLNNLVSNAIKYSPQGGDVIVSSGHENGHIFVNVEDKGMGMSEDTQKMLFHRFSRSQNPLANTFPGLGLGLYISSEIVKRHGGTIIVESKEAQGSKFTLSLPVSHTTH